MPRTDPTILVLFPDSLLLCCGGFGVIWLGRGMDIKIYLSFPRMLFKKGWVPESMVYRYLLRFGEIALKGANRKEFERALQRNVRSHLQKNGGGSVVRIPGRLFVVSEQAVLFRYVFGLVSASKVIECGPSELNAVALDWVSGRSYDTFKVETQRLEKKGKTSNEINVDLGGFLVEKTGKKVRLKDPDLTVGVEVAGDRFFLIEETEKCFGGLPVGTQGKVAVLVEDRLSLLCVLLLLKRGCRVVPFLVGAVDLSEIDAYSPFEFEDVVVGSNVVGALLSERKLGVLVVNDILPEIREEMEGFTLLRPLIGYSKEEAETELGRYL